MDSFYYWLSVFGTLSTIINFIGFFLIIMSRTYRHSVYNISKFYDKGQKVIYGLSMLSFTLSISLSVFGWIVLPASMVREMDSPVVSWLLFLAIMEFMELFLIIVMFSTNHGPLISPPQITILNVCILLLYCITHEFDSHYGVTTAFSIISILINAIAVIYPSKVGRFIYIPQEVVPLNTEREKIKVSYFAKLCCITRSDINRILLKTGIREDDTDSQEEMDVYKQSDDKITK